MLDFRRVSLLVGVARHGSISAAAAEAGCTASSASEQLAKLEAELGVALLERSPRRVRLTAAGRELAGRGRALLADADAAERAVRDVAGSSGGRLRVAAYRTGATRFVLPAIAAFGRKRPDARVTFEEMEPEFGLSAVANGAADIALIATYLGVLPSDIAGLNVLELGRDPFVLATPSTFSPVTEPVSLVDFSATPWIGAKPDSGFQAIVELAAARAGFLPNIIARADNYDLMLDLVANGLGVALVPSRAVREYSTIRTFALNESFDLCRLESLVTRTSDRSAATAELCRLIVRYFGK